MEAEDLGLLDSPARNDVNVETADQGQSLITQILSEYLDLSKYLHHNGKILQIGVHYSSYRDELSDVSENLQS